jgi:dimethylaniline monooxygenase (N-oxide forming)
MKNRRIAVIGAGAGGLSAARHLVEDGQDVTIFEKGSHVGGLWIYDNDNGLSAAYRSLHINSEPSSTHFRGYPFPNGTSLFPSHWDVAAYLRSFADHYGLRDRTRFNSHVTSVEPVEGQRGNGWTLRLADGSAERFDEVVVASGHQGVPAHPDTVGRFTGEYLHSHDYRHPESFRDKRVLVIGAGNSGLDIAADACLVASETHLAARSPVLVMPRMVFGVPTPRILSTFNKPYIPWPVQRQVMRTISRVFHGRMEQWGLRTPKGRTHPASSPTFMTHVAYGRIGIRPGITDIIGNDVYFSDGTTLSIDVIVAATGYKIDLPFLTGDVSPVTDHHVDLYKRVVHPDWPGLYFIGFFNVSGGANISMMDVQAEWVTELIAGRAALPSTGKMREDIENERRIMSHTYPGSPRYGLELDPIRYRRQMADLKTTRPQTQTTPTTHTPKVLR